MHEKRNVDLPPKNNSPEIDFLKSPTMVLATSVHDLPTKQNENPNTNLFVDQYGDVNLYLAKGKSYQDRETPYSAFQNRLPLAVRYTNERLADRNEKENQLLLCAEKNGEILFLNDIIPFSFLPAEVQKAIVDKYPNPEEREALFASDIKHAYEVIFYAYQAAGYRIEVRVGNEDTFREDMASKSVKNLQKDYPYMTDAKYFENREKPRFIVPFDQPVLLQEENQFLIFKDYFRSLNEELEIYKARERQAQKLENISLEIKEQHEGKVGYIISPHIKDVGNKTCQLEWNLINPKDFFGKINQFHAHLNQKYQKENDRNRSHSHAKRGNKKGDIGLGNVAFSYLLLSYFTVSYSACKTNSPTPST